jgi:AraC-like DNA-binding protein
MKAIFMKNKKLLSKYSIFKLLVLLLFFSGLNLCHSQNSHSYYIPDSLKNKSYKELYENYNLNYSDTTKLKIYAAAYLHKAKNEKDTIRIANGYSQFASISSIKNKSLAINYCDSIIIMTKDNESFDYPGFAFMVKGICYYNLGDYEKALNNYLTAHKYATKQNNIGFLIYIKDGIGNIKALWGNNKEALEIRKSMFEILSHQNELSRMEYHNQYFRVLLSLSGSYILTSKLDSAFIYAHKGLREALKKKDTFWYYSFVGQIGEVAYYQNNFKMALDSLDKALPHERSYNGLLNDYYYRGNIYWKQHKDAKAFYYFKKADSIYDVSQDIVPEVRDIQEFFVSYYKKSKNTQNQLKYINRLLYVDSIIAKNRIHLNETIIKQYDTPLLLAEKQRIINSLNKEKKKTSFIIIGLGVLIILAIAIVIRSIKKQRIYKERFNKLLYDEKIVTKSKNKKLTNELIGVSKENIEVVLRTLNIFEIENGFLDNKITLHGLSKSLNTNSNYLSKIINFYKEKNFSSYISDLRIDYCVDKLKKDKIFRKYTIKAVAFDIGFNNTETFSKAFYKKTGIYPSYFIRELEKQY